MKLVPFVLATSALAAAITLGITTGSPRAQGQGIAPPTVVASAGPLAALQEISASSRRNDYPFDSVIHAQQDGGLGRKTLLFSSIFVPASGTRLNVHTITPDQEMDLHTVSIFTNDFALNFYIFEQLDLNAIDPAMVRWTGRHRGPENSVTFQLVPPIRLRNGTSLLVQQSNTGGVGGAVELVLHGATVPGISLADTLRVE